MISKPSARGLSANYLNINTTTIGLFFRLTKVEQAILYKDDLPSSVRDFFRRIADIPIYERISTYVMSKMEATRKKKRIRIRPEGGKKKQTHHLTVCSEPHFQTEVESGKRTGGTNTSRFSSSTGAVATREMKEMIEKIMVVNFIAN